MAQRFQVLLITDDNEMERRIVDDLNELVPSSAALEVNWRRRIEEGLVFLLQQPDRVDLIICWNLRPEREIGQGRLKRTRPARHNEAERLGKCLCALERTTPMIVHDGDSISSPEAKVYTCADPDVGYMTYHAEAYDDPVRRLVRELVRQRAA